LPVALACSAAIALPSAADVARAAAEVSSPAYTASVRFGGADGRVDTLAKVRAFTRAVHSTAELRALLMALRPSDRTYVIKMGFMPARRVTTVVSSMGEVNVSPPQITTDASVFTSSCLSFSKVETTKTNDYAWTGFHIAEYQSTWEWSGRCYVHAANHQETSLYTGIGWSYNGRRYGAKYGRLDSPMIGRETFGTFQWGIIVPAYDYVDQQVQVNGGWGHPAYGMWHWAKWSGA
jgi:hypothetical protein